MLGTMWRNGTAVEATFHHPVIARWPMAVMNALMPVASVADYLTLAWQAAAGVTIAVDKGGGVTLSGIDKKVVGQAAADIRAFRKPDSYKGKGIRHAGEYIRLKAGKSAK